MLRRRHLAQLIGVGRLTRQDVVPWDRLERFGGERQVHRVAGLVVEVYREPREDGVHLPDAPKTPAPMHAETGIGQMHQGFNMVSLQFARCCHLLEFFSHKVS